MCYEVREAKKGAENICPFFVELKITYIFSMLVRLREYNFDRIRQRRTVINYSRQVLIVYDFRSANGIVAIVYNVSCNFYP